MRSIIPALLMLLVAFAGCAEEVPVNDDEVVDAGPEGEGQSEDPQTSAPGEKATDPALGSFNASLLVEGDDPTAGEAINVSLGSDLADDLAANATWVATLYNYTMDSVGANQTGAAPVDQWNGVGLPAMLAINLTSAGNHTLSFVASADGHNDATASTVFSVAEAIVEDAAPAIPDPIVITGSLSGPSVAGFPGGTNTHTFTLATPVSAMKFHMEHGRMAGGAPEVDNDLDWSWAGPGVSGSAAANYGPEGDVNIGNPSPGEWSIDMELYSTPSKVDYTLTITFS